jgi:nucleotide-binding universal stress UspA family protein
LEDAPFDCGVDIDVKFAVREPAGRLTIGERSVSSALLDSAIALQPISRLTTDGCAPDRHYALANREATMSLEILVPLDGSPFSERALPTAIALASRCRGTLHLVRVYDQVQNVKPPGRKSLDVNGYLDRPALQAQMGGANNTRTAVLYGHAGSAIESYIAAANISLVVMTTHGRSGLGRLWLGSLADDLIRRLTVPLLLLRPKGHKQESESTVPSHVMIALDGSELSEMILEPALWLARIAGARITLVHVLQMDLPTTYGAVVEAQIHDGVSEHLRAEAAAYMQSMSERIAQSGFDVNTMILEGAPPAPGILKAAASCNAQMLAMTTHGRSGWDRFALGSVEGEVVHATHLPMLVLRSETLVGATESWSTIGA